MLYHFSENPAITRFVPRALKTPRPRPAGQDWLNGPLVWAISEAFAFLYLFPRDCPRIVAWATADSNAADQAEWLGPHKRVAYVQDTWMPRITEAKLHKYALPSDTFTSLGDVGMHVSCHEVLPSGVTQLIDLPARLQNSAVSLRPVPSLVPYKHLWVTTLHVSGIRLRHAKDRH